MRVVTVFRVLTVMFLLTGVVALLWQPSLPRTGDVPMRVAPSARVAAGSVQETRAAEQVVNGNIFSSNRKPPAARYLPLSGEAEPTASAPDADAARDTAGVAPEESVPHLYGTVLNATDASALLRLDPAIPEPRLYRVGDRAGGFRVVRIAEHEVTIEGRRGRIVLRLTRPEGESR